MIEPAILILAYILDLAIGDPKQIPHPVRIIGWLITKTEGLLRHVIQNAEDRTSSTETREKLAGVLLVLIIVTSTYGLFYVINSALLTFHFSPLSYYLFFLFLVYLISTTLATRELLKSAQSVLEALKTGSMESARKSLSCIVGRDTKPLDRDKILKAAIESLAENASDGIIAPLIYLSIGGLPLAMAYKAINTLDSMVGYKNERYRDFGWAAAKLDDLANYIPARLTGVLIVIAVFINSASRYVVQSSSKWLKIVQNRTTLNYIEQPLNRVEQHMRKLNLSGINAYKIMIRDGKRHSSPNSGIPEAAMAGALGIRLGGPSVYEGTRVEKPYIGEESSSLFNVAQDSSKMDDKTCCLRASENAIVIVKVVSLLGLFISLTIIYVKGILGIQF